MKNWLSFLIHQRFNPGILGENKKKILRKIYHKNKCLIPRLKKDNDPISAKYAAQILSLNLP